MSSILAMIADGTSWKPYYSMGTSGVVQSITGAWCGGAFDYTTNTMHIVACGGHADSWNNQCYSIQVPNGSWIMTASQTPFPPDQHVAGYAPVNREDGQPTAGTGYYLRPDGSTVPVSPSVDSAVVYFDGHPCSRHTYGGSIWLPAQKRVMLMAGACWFTGPVDSYSGWFDPVTGTWERKTNLPKAAPGIVTSYDATRNLVVYCANGTQNVYTYDPATDTHTRIGPVGSDPLAGGVGGPYLQCCVDGAGTYLYATVKGGWKANWANAPAAYDNAIIRMPLGSKSGLQAWQPVKVAGDVTGMYGTSPGMEYDPDKNAFVFWSAQDSGNISVLRLADFRIYRVPIKGTAPGTADTTAGVWGRFRRYGAHSYCLMTSANVPVNLITLG